MLDVSGGRSGLTFTKHSITEDETSTLSQKVRHRSPSDTMPYEKSEDQGKKKKKSLITNNV
jgi:hypothetical protein